ncbi:hypothetical protein CDAR_457811 [Caerostris darwini]|uniref:Uncharacterized protein n=1 Tax=Caerostris darwini TaxID=1538125 RepID=A0AAV4V8N8_9ARAC|nr:hypothetical protein CDAR_457811 [Caerostris darwini]
MFRVTCPWTLVIRPSIYSFKCIRVKFGSWDASNASITFNISSSKQPVQTREVPQNIHCSSISDSRIHNHLRTHYLMPSPNSSKTFSAPNPEFLRRAISDVGMCLGRLRN